MSSISCGPIRTGPGILRAAPADGAFYAFVKVAGDDTEIATRRLEKGHVAVTPGSAFDASGWLRLFYAASMDRLKEAMGRISRFDTLLNIRLLFFPPDLREHGFPGDHDLISLLPDQRREVLFNNRLLLRGLRIEPLVKEMFHL
jgi:hypothetical protein